MIVSALTDEVPDSDTTEPIWTPDPDRVASATITRFAAEVSARTGRWFGSYTDLWPWSVGHLEQFWATVWDFFEVAADGTPRPVLADATMPGARWFPGTRLNYAEHALRAGTEPRRADAVAVTAIDEDGSTTTTTWAELRAQVAAFAGWLRGTGVRAGDRVVGYLPNDTPTLVAFLASASIGAVWSACGQDYSPRCGRTLRPARAGGARRRRRLPVERPGRRPAGEVAELERRCPRCAPPSAWPTSAWRCRRIPAWAAYWQEVMATPGELRFERGAVRPPAVGAVLLRHHRHAEGHRARPRRRGARAPQAPRPAPGPQARPTGSAGTRPPAG